MYAHAGLGKTWLSLKIASAMVAGQTIFNRWIINESTKVLYIDGEMGEDIIVRRMHKISVSFNDLTDEQKGLMHKDFLIRSVNGLELDLSKEEDQDKIDDLLKKASRTGSYNKKVKLLVLDNLVSLTGFNDTSKSWQGTFKWLKDLKDSGIAVLLIHHANKEGAQRGTAHKIASVDNVLRMEKEKASTPSSLAMSIHVEKGRELAGVDKHPMKVEFFPESKTPYWKRIRSHIAKEDYQAKAEDLIASGEYKKMGNKEIAEHLGMNPNTFQQRKGLLGFPVRPKRKSKKKR